MVFVGFLEGTKLKFGVTVLADRPNRCVPKLGLSHKPNINHPAPTESS